MTPRRPLKLLVLGLAFAVPAVAQEAHGHGEARHGNPADLQRYIRGLRDPERDAWQQPDRVVESLGLEKGQTACDVGAGPGYFTLRLARAVGDAGRVYAVDVEPVILGALREALAGTGLRNVTPVLGLPEDPLLPRGVCDVVLIVDTYHHFPDGPAYLRRLAGALSPAGRVVNIDFRIDATHGPRHKISRADFLAQAREGGFELEREETFLEQQYFAVLRPAS